MASTKPFDMLNHPQFSTVTAKPDVEKDSDVVVEEKEEKLWKVIAHDDNKTTMEFVVRVMVQVFKKPVIFAEAIMWQVHNEGQSVVDALPKSEAKFRKKKAMAMARLEGFPFRLTIEPND